jgi:phospholipid N-methyltransferase
MPSSLYVVRQIIQRIPADAKYVVEYGPGNGVITRAILERLPPDGMLAVIERNTQFIEGLLCMAADDPRLMVLQGDVVEYSKDLRIAGLPRIDAVVSGIPFTFIKPDDRNTVVQSTYDALARAGVFLVYQTSRFFAGPLLQRYFSYVVISHALWNFPPYIIMCGVK